MSDHVENAHRRAARRGSAVSPTGSRTDRTVWRSLVEARGLVGGHDAAGRVVRLHTDDGEALRAWWAPGPSTVVGDAVPAVVLLHGFAARATKPAYAWLADELAASTTVLAPTLRGHGGSTGRTTLGRAEVADVAAAVAWLRDAGHGRIALVGASMGATTAANAIAAGVDVDAAVLISSPAYMEDVPTTGPMQQLHRLWTSPLGRLGVRLVAGVRLEHPDEWLPPIDPESAVSGWDGPLLVVHDADDPYFPGMHADRIAAREGGTTTRWDEPGFGHAEDGFHGDLGWRLSRALRIALASGRFPDREASTWQT